MLVSSLAAQNTNLVIGRPQITLSGHPAPPPSSAVCGLVLVAQSSGPQILLSEKPSTAWISLQPGEHVEIAIPLFGLNGETHFCATASVEDPGDLSGELSLNQNSVQIPDFTPGAMKIRLMAVPRAGENILRLRVAARQSSGALRWEKVTLQSGSEESNISLYPGSGNLEVCPPPVLPAYRPPIERALVEWDWRWQDGIGTERIPATYQAAIERLVQRGDSLLADLRNSGVSAPKAMRDWSTLRQQWTTLKASPAAADQTWGNLWRQLHQARRALAFANPLAHTGPVAFIKQVPGMFSHQLTQYYGSCARPGGGLFLLENPGETMASRELAGQNLPLGSYQHIDVSWDADHLLFSYCPAATVPKDRESCLDRYFHLYEINRDGTGLRQLTQGPFDDFSPRYLPDDRLVFVSTRRGGFHRCGRGPCPIYTLTLAESDGSQVRTISHHETHEWDPAVLADGRIVYTRWDYVDRHAVYYEQLWAVRPDGSGVRIFYGNNTFNPVGVWEAQSVPGSHRIMATAGAHHAMTAGSIILLDPFRGVDGSEPVQRLTPDALFPESEAPVASKPAGNWSATAGIERPPAVPTEAQRWPGHSYRSAWPLSDKYFLAAYSYDALIGEPTWNPANMFGLYLVDAFGNKELLYRDLNIASLWPVPVRPRPRPARTTTLAESEPAGEGTFFVQNIYTSWPALHGEAIRALRIVQVLPKSTPHANTPTVGLANASPGKQVLGTVPVETDGSAYFRAPAGIPLAFQALDEQGRAVQMMRSVTYLQPGEHAACIGCHESRLSAPPPGSTALAIRRSPSVIKPGPEGSRPLSYPLLVQPVLDRQCVPCHKAGKREGKVELTGQAQGRYTVSYNALAPKVSYSDWAGKAGDFRQVNREPMTPPGFFGARGTPWMNEVLAGRHFVHLSSEESERLITWMDANALFYGTFDQDGQAKQQMGMKIAGPAVQ